MMEVMISNGSNKRYVKYIVISKEKDDFLLVKNRRKNFLIPKKFTYHVKKCDGNIKIKDIIFVNSAYYNEYYPAMVVSINTKSKICEARDVWGLEQWYKIQDVYQIK